MTYDRASTPDSPPPKNNGYRPWLMAGLLLAAALVLFLTFRPVSQEEMVADDGEVKSYDPVVYDTSDWQTASQQSQDFEVLKSALSATATSEEALDFYGNKATRYRFSTPFEPPFYVIESPNLFELVWYYAAPTDDDATKAQSIDFAKRSYRMMSMVGGGVGTKIVEQMLQGAAVSSQTVGGFVLERGACEDYRCQIILRQ